MEVVKFDVAKDKLEDYLTFSEAAKMLDVRFQQVYQRYEKGKFHSVKTLFNKLLVSKEDIEIWKLARANYFAKLK